MTELTTTVTTRPYERVIAYPIPVRTQTSRLRPAPTPEPETPDPEIYARLFWRPFLGNTTFALWDILKALDLDQDGRVETPVTIQELAALMGAGDRFTILGRNATKSRPAQVGALERLADAGLVTYTASGYKNARRYSFRVVHDPPELDQETVEAQLGKVAGELHYRYLTGRLTTP